MSVESSTYEKWPAAFATSIAWLQKYSLLIWAALGTAAIIGWFLRRQGDPWIWDKLQALLDEFQAVAYPGFQHHIKDHHRVTLFKYKKWYWCLRTPMTNGRWPWRRGRYPWSGWLVPMLRSGRTSQNTRAVFLVPDNGGEAEGVAGRAWASNCVIVVDKLPAISAQSSRRKIKQYAEGTYCPEPIIKDYLERSRPLPRSIGAIPIEVDNKAWGILVLDSRDEQGVTSDLVANFTLTIKFIGQMLEKAK
ncbi:hypothetical protein [Rhodospirillaceae bacterium SYSU D60014]|uniref:hypothetical protein n=1 Tax=Virgifigura deserti TaxID=2268457 RepID=UPI0013C4D264